MIDKYMNGTTEIIYINSIGESVLDRLSGADFDSDSLMITDNSVDVYKRQVIHSPIHIPT